MIRAVNLRKITGLGYQILYDLFLSEEERGRREEKKKGGRGTYPMEIFGSASYADLMNLDITTYLFTSSPNYISAFPTGGSKNGDR